MLTSDVGGHLSAGQVVECWAQLGDWLQIRYKNETCMWVLKVAGQGDTLGTFIPPPKPIDKRVLTGKMLPDKKEVYSGPKILISELHVSVQMRLGYVMKRSPYDAKPEDLEIDESFVPAKGEYDEYEKEEDFHDTDAVFDENEDENKVEEVVVKKYKSVVYHKSRKLLLEKEAKSDV